MTQMSAAAFDGVEYSDIVDFEEYQKWSDFRDAIVSSEMFAAVVSFM
jgi:hypothetical protein